MKPLHEPAGEPRWYISGLWFRDKQISHADTTFLLNKLHL